MSRFDPHIFSQYAHNTQSFNRYSYVLNNPVGATDPSGYFTKWLRKMNQKSWFRYVVAGAAIGAAIGITIITGGAGAPLIAQSIASGFAGAFTGSFLSGAGLRSAVSAGVKGALFGAAAAGVANVIGHGFSGTGGLAEGSIAKRLAHGVSQGALADAQGQSFRSGFIGGFVGDVVPNQGSFAKDVVVSSLAGGVVAELGGGNFKDGARSAAFVRLFNHHGDKVISSNGDADILPHIEDDGNIDLNEANANYRSGEGQPLNQDSSQLSLQITGVNQNGGFNAKVLGKPWLVHGSVHVDGQGAISSEFYNFEMHNWADSFSRNLKTLAGNAVAGGGTEFVINYYNLPGSIDWNGFQ